MKEEGIRERIEGNAILFRAACFLLSFSIHMIMDSYKMSRIVDEMKLTEELVGREAKKINR